MPCIITILFTLALGLYYLICLLWVGLLYFSNLSIQTDTKGFIEIEGLTEVPVLDFAKARWWYNRGKRVRSTAWTNVNEASSRSHWWVTGLVRFLTMLHLISFG